MEQIQKLSYTALAAVQGIGTHSIKRLHDALIKHKIGWSDFWVLSEGYLEKMSLQQRQIDGIKSFKKEHTIYSYAELLHIRDIRVVVHDDVEFPKLLLQCRSAPLVLFAKGSVVQLKGQPIIAVVGTRQITAYGSLVTKKIVSELTRMGALIVSGCMYGVDLLAHQTAIGNGGQTIGVLGYGFDHYYPQTQRETMEELLSQGMTFYSPFAPHITPQKGHFPARNRVVAGMSHAVVVTEAALKSGSHITAGYAVDEGRIVCAVPGPITNPFSEGTKSLVNQGAVLVSSGMEVLQECGVESVSHAEPGSNKQSTKGTVASLLQSGPLTVDEVSRALEMDYVSTLSLLTRLQLQGKIKKEASRWHLNGS